MTDVPLSIAAAGLAVARGGRTVFEDVSFALAAGEALVVTGPNGAGKSTLLRLIAGLITPLAGTLRRAGGAEDTPIAAQCHYFGHQDALKPALTLTETLAFWRAYLAPDGVGGDIDAALAAVGLDHLADLPAGFLSAGQRRRLAFARLLVAPRPLWLLDEPTSALDVASEARLVARVAAHLDAGGLAIVATHLPINLPRAGALRLGAAPAVAA